MVGSGLRTKRAAAGIAGIVLCRKAGISRGYLSEIERGTATATPDEITRLNTVLDDLIRAKFEIQKAAAAAGWPSAVGVAV